MSRALDELVITGVPTTAPFHKLILATEAFKAGDVSEKTHRGMNRRGEGL